MFVTVSVAGTRNLVPADAVKSSHDEVGRGEYNRRQQTEIEQQQTETEQMKGCYDADGRTQPQ